MQLYPGNRKHILHMSLLVLLFRFYCLSVAQHGLEEPSSEVAALISHATQERLKNIVEKLAVIAEHRIDLIKVRGMWEHSDFV
jgi:transcription initiation factor TFIID subunit 4